MIRQGERVIDDTYGTVYVDGKKLDLSIALWGNARQQFLDGGRS